MKPKRNNDIKAVERVVKKLTALKASADTKALEKKTRRNEILKKQMAEYKTEEEISEAYGWELISLDERDALMELLQGVESPDHAVMTVDEIYALEIQDLLSQAKKRLRDLEWDALPKAEKERILKIQEDRVEEKKRREKVYNPWDF